MKKVLFLLAMCFGMFFSTDFVKAGEVGPVAVQAIVEKGYNLEITVNLVNAETEELIKAYKLNEKNKWEKKGEVPVGRYKIYTYIDGLEVRALTKIKGTLSEKEVVANPPKTKYYDGTPTFVVMEGSEEFLSKYFGIVDYERIDGSMVKGSMSDDDMYSVYKETISHQRGTTDPLTNDDGYKPSLANDAAGPQHLHEHDHEHGEVHLDEKDVINHGHVNELESEYTPEKLKETAKEGLLFKAEEKHTKGLFLIAFVLTSLGSISAFIWLKMTKRHER